jgi:TonB family protein
VQLQRSSGHARLDEAAQAAAWASTYRPALRGQRPVTTRTTIAFTFRLTESDGR